MWRAHSASEWLHDVRLNGLQLPLIEGKFPPQSHVSENCIPVGEQLEWARGAVAELEKFGAVSKWSNVLATGGASSPRPHVIMPLIVGEKSSSTPEKRKFRLIHDCRYVNKFLEQRPFKLEQLPEFVKQLQRDDRLFVADITSAYHHVEIAKRFRTLLGFTFDGIDYVYNCLPFGLSVSAYVFCEFSAVTARALRSSGLTKALINYVDDFGGSIGPKLSRWRVDKIIRLFRDFGWCMQEAKCNLAMERQAVLLGFLLDTQAMTIDVPPARRAKLKATATRILKEHQVPARLVCQLVGQIQANQLAFGLVCRLRSRYLQLAIRGAAQSGHYGMIVPVDGRARSEVELWLRDLDTMTPRPMHEHQRRANVTLHCDASDSAVAAIVVGSDVPSLPVSSKFHRELQGAERRWSSTLREMTGYRHTVDTLSQNHPDAIRGRLIEIVGDSQCASYIFANGGSQVVEPESGLLLLTDTLLAILEAAARGGFDVRFRWVKRELVQDADDLSKFVDRMDFSLDKLWFRRVTIAYGSCDVDRFAAAHNTKCARFNSMFDAVGAEAVDAFAQDWGSGRSYILPDFYAVSKVLDHIERWNATATLIVPEWPAESWWHRIWSGAWSKRIRRHEHLPGEALVPNNEHCFFLRGTEKHFHCRLLVLDIGPI